MRADGDVKYQYLASFCVNILTLSYGAYCGWPSVSFLELTAPDSPLESGPLTPQEAGWVGSLICIGGLFGSIFFAWLMEKIGRKSALLLMAIPSLIGWLIIPLARTSMQLCIARFIGGFAGGGVFQVVPIYTAELAADSVRGILGTFLVLSCNIGILIVFILGYYFNYAMTALIMSSSNLIFLVTFAFLPETPQYLMSKNKFGQAEAALRYYRNVRARHSKELSEDLQYELQKLRSADKDNDKEKDKDKDKDEVEVAVVDNAITWSDLTNRVARKSLFIGLGLMALNQLCGVFAMLVYSATIFKEAGSQLPPTVCAILVALIQLVGTYVSTALVERAGRKILLLISAIGIALGLASFSGYSYLTVLGYDTSGYRWVPLVSFSFVIFIAAWGVMTLPFLVISETTPPKIRNIANMFCMNFLWILATLMIKFMPIISVSLGMHGTTLAFCICSVIGAIFVAIFVPETKGKTIETILASL